MRKRSGGLGAFGSAAIGFQHVVFMNVAFGVRVWAYVCVSHLFASSTGTHSQRAIFHWRHIHGIIRNLYDFECVCVCVGESYEIPLHNAWYWMWRCRRVCGRRAKEQKRATTSTTERETLFLLCCLCVLAWRVRLAIAIPSVCRRNRNRIYAFVFRTHFAMCTEKSDAEI